MTNKKRRGARKPQSKKKALAGGKGGFSGKVVAKWRHDGRTMKLKKSLTFTDRAGRKWKAPAGTKINGASIPKLFWGLVGAPYSGKFRRASVIHDAYCQTRERSARKTHKMFYEAMRADGVKRWKARLFYKAVRSRSW